MLTKYYLQNPKKQTDMFKVTSKYKHGLCSLVLFLFGITLTTVHAQNPDRIIIDKDSPYLINETVLGRSVNPGDTIFIKSDRTKALRFESIEGSEQKPVVIINQGGQVKIDATTKGDWGALVFLNARYIKVSGTGHPGFKYGFDLRGNIAGLVFGELSTDCEAEHIKISYSGFFGILAKKDYNGNPPSPIPVFKNLSIHDCFIQDTAEGFYLGETKSPGMEFKHVKIYNNIILNTRRESIQISNMTEDVEIYNNTMINAGLEETYYHMNNLQIGDNSVANVHHNIIIGAPEYGIINFGKGEVSITSNYIASNKGILCDSRTIIDTLASIHIENNYFKSIAGDEILRNRNEYNFLIAINNFYDGTIDFYKDETEGSFEFYDSNQQIDFADIEFTNPTINNYKLRANTDPRFIDMGAPGGSEYFKYNNPATTPRLLTVTPEMISDSVPGGSVFSPKFLFDEQELDFDANSSPVSASWKPDDEMNADAYHAVLDLGDEHYVSEIRLHDMEGDYDFTVEYYTNHTWKTLLVENGDAYNTWKFHRTNIETRYLRFSMYDSPNAAINEVLVYGYPIIRNSQRLVIHPSMVTDQVVGGSLDSPTYLFDEQSIDIESDEHPESKSWKPFYNSTNAPYYAVVDLGKDYHISKVKLHDMHDIQDFIIEYREGEEWNELVYENCDAFKVWKKHYTNVVTRYLRLVMPGSPYASINEIVLYGYPVMSFPNSQLGQFKKIPIESYMVNDKVHRGSIESPHYLFDEQELDPFLGQHPESKSWKPFYNESRAPYYAEVDLIDTYKISQVLLHDMEDAAEFTIEYQDSYNNWVPLLTESCDQYNVWKVHNVNVTTNKLRFSMQDSPNANINEIQLFGHLVYKKAQKPGVTFDNLNDLQLFPNPTQQQLFIKGVSAAAKQHEIRVVTFLGKTIYYKSLSTSNITNTIAISLLQKEFTAGSYILFYKNDVGQQRTFTFIKN